jgi:hypothetical protein
VSREHPSSYVGGWREGEVCSTRYIEINGTS